MATQNTTTQPRPQSTVPTTIEQILSCKDTQFRIYGTTIHIVCLVGIIRKITIESSEIKCQIQDNSGTIGGMIRVETAAEVAVKLNGIQENSYVKVFGFVRNQDGRKAIFILKIFPVDDANVITNQILQAYCFTLDAKTEMKKHLASANSTGMALADSLVMSEDGEGETSFVEPEFTDFQRLVFNIIRSECSEDGITKRNVLKQFPLYQSHDVNQALEFLINEGIVYYSIDQEYLKIAVP